MARRSNVLALPPELREELNARLVGGGFQGYEGLAQWLAEQGYGISKSALHRYGRDLQADFETAMADVQKTTALARAFAQSDEDERGDLIDATARIVQDHLLRISIALRQAEHEPDQAARHISQVTRALADLGRISLSQKKWAAEWREKTAAKLADMEGRATSGKAGFDLETLRRVREELYGII